MARLARIDAVATALQLGLLGLVALIPAATRMIVSVQLKTQDVYLLYLGLIAACGAVNGANWLYAAFSGRLLAPEVTRGAALAQAISAIATPVLTSTAVLTFIRQPSGMTVGVLVAVVVVLGLGRRAASRRFPI